MNNEGKILDLVLDGSGLKADQLTHNLKVIGGGDMAEGITQIAEFSWWSGCETGIVTGIKYGIPIGLGIAAVGLGVRAIYKGHIKKVEKRAAMWQRFDDQCRASDKEHWVEFNELKKKAEQCETDSQNEAIESLEFEPTA